MKSSTTFWTSLMTLTSTYCSTFPADTVDFSAASSDDEDSDSTQLNEPAKKVVLATSSVKLQLDIKEMMLIMQFANVYG